MHSLPLLKRRVGHGVAWRHALAVFDDVLMMVGREAWIFFRLGHGQLAVRSLSPASSDGLWGSAPSLFFTRSTEMMPRRLARARRPGPMTTVQPPGRLKCSGLACPGIDRAGEDFSETDMAAAEGSGRPSPSNASSLGFDGGHDVRCPCPFLSSPRV